MADMKRYGRRSPSDLDILRRHIDPRLLVWYIRYKSVWVIFVRYILNDSPQLRRPSMTSPSPSTVPMLNRLLIHVNSSFFSARWPSKRNIHLCSRSRLHIALGLEIDWSP